MNPQELRIGNWIYPAKNSIPMQVVSFGADYIYLDFEGNEGGVWEPIIKEMCGIPLTDELLLKLGFHKQCSEDEKATPTIANGLNTNTRCLGLSTSATPKSTCLPR